MRIQKRFSHRSQFSFKQRIQKINKFMLKFGEAYKDIFDNTYRQIILHLSK